MLGLGKTGRVRASATASSARSRDSYQHYAVALYRQALLTLDDPAMAEHVVGDVVTNEYALARGQSAAKTMRVITWPNWSSGAVTSWWPARRGRIAAPAYSAASGTSGPAECWESISVTWRSASARYCSSGQPHRPRPVRTAIKQVAPLQGDGNPAAEAGTGTTQGRCPLRDEEYQMSRAAVADPPAKKEEMMRALGYVTAITLTAAGIGLGVLAVMSLPETRRYLAMRKI